MNGLRTVLLLALVLGCLSPLASAGPVDLNQGVLDAHSSLHSHKDSPLGRLVNPRAGAAPVWNSEDAANPYGVRFRCASDVDIQGGGGAGGAIVNDQMCPALIWDPTYLMSQPILLVDPKNPVLQGFNALHGGRGVTVPVAGAPQAISQPPSERSRLNDLWEPHTTHASVNMGLGWNDYPYFAPDTLSANGRRVFGEENAAVLDADGRLYVASLYAYQEQGDQSYKWAVTLWKFNHLNEPFGYHDNPVVVKANGYNKLDNIFLTYSKEADRVVVLWRESHDNRTPETSRHTSWINASVTKPGDDSAWETLASIQQIGPCRDTTNPIPYGGLVYVGCLPDAGYQAGPNASVDYLQIHSIDPLSGTTAHVSTTPYSDGHFLLALRGQTGHMILINSGVAQTGKPFVRVSYGALGGRWNNPSDYGSDFVKAPKGVTVIDARVTAAAYTTETGYLHVIYAERYNPDSKDASKPAARTIYKTYAVLRPQTGFQGEFNLGFGNQTGRVPWGVERQGGVSEGIFFDQHDSIVVWNHPRTGKERIFTAFGDYGYVRQGEVVEENALPAVPLPAIGTPPVPLAVEVGTPASVGAAAAALTALMLLRLLAARKAATTKVTA